MMQPSGPVQSQTFLSNLCDARTLDASMFELHQVPGARAWLIGPCFARIRLGPLASSGRCSRNASDSHSSQRTHNALSAASLYTVSTTIQQGAHAPVTATSSTAGSRPPPADPVTPNPLNKIGFCRHGTVLIWVCVFVCTRDQKPNKQSWDCPINPFLLKLIGEGA